MTYSMTLKAIGVQCIENMKFSGCSNSMCGMTSVEISKAGLDFIVKDFH